MDNAQNVGNMGNEATVENEAHRVGTAGGTGRGAVRAGAVTAVTALALLLSSPAASAVIRDDGDDPGPGLSLAETLGLYVLAPVVLFLVITGLVMAGDRRKNSD